MSDVKYKYIQNTHNAPITCHTRDEKGKVLITKKFMPMLSEKFSGKIMHTGYERLTEDEYNAFVKTSKTFQVFSGMTGKVKLLVTHDELPVDAKSPHEALVDARKDVRKHAARIAELEGVIEKLKAELFDSQEAYKKLSSASTDEEKLKPLNDKIAELEAEKQEADKLIDKASAFSEGLLTKLENLSKNNKANVDDVIKLFKDAREAYDKLLEEVEQDKDKGK